MTCWLSASINSNAVSTHTPRKPAVAAIGRSAADFVRVRNGSFELRGRPAFFHRHESLVWLLSVRRQVEQRTQTHGARIGPPQGHRREQHPPAGRFRDLAPGREPFPAASPAPPGTTTRTCWPGWIFVWPKWPNATCAAYCLCQTIGSGPAGFAQYVRWITGETIPDPDQPVQAKGDWEGFIQFSARLYTWPRPTSFIWITSPISSSGATRSTAAFTATTRRS